ncbi:MAG TPA: flavin reductase [Eubacteriaceae bacterium]|jgi:flavin reductase (DIM6/NTAB) family NADH-FMN oxidoreductase RutF|nr:flavin reductase [Eubacteriaceae bacterium]
MEKLFTAELEEAMESLHLGGAFLNTRNAQTDNTMTISWGMIGYQWKRPVFMVLVRKSRFTHDILETSDEFTVSIPKLGKMKEALAICGSKSGRDTDKFTDAGLTKKIGKKVSVPVIGDCFRTYECKVVYKQDMDPSLLDPGIEKIIYNGVNHHTLYYGEILESY